MRNFLFNRLISATILVFVVTSITFLMVFGGADNVAQHLLGESATAEQVAAKEAELGLDQPLLVQYGNWVSAAVTGDLGRSWSLSEPVTTILSTRLPVTLSMVIVSVVLTTLISVVLGVVAAVRGGWIDRMIQTVSVIGFALPNFLVAMILVLLFALWLPWLPATGYVGFTSSPLAWAATLILPVTAMAMSGIASAAQQVRGAVIDVLEQDYIRTLRARGLSPTSVLFRHALRNAASPVLTVLSLQFIGLLGGAVVIERVFAIPGLGMLTVDAALVGDIPILMGVVTMLVILVSIINLLIDLATAWVNPKVRSS